MALPLRSLAIAFVDGQSLFNELVDVRLTGRTETRIVASRATIREIIDKVSITRYSCLCGFHSAGTSLTASTSSGARKAGFSVEKDIVELRLVGSLETAIALWVGSFSDISKMAKEESYMGRQCW
jgi:hypothetical protein